jgi:hypothetical protein
MPGKCKFLNTWLEQPQYHAWLKNSPDIHKAHFKCCNKILTFSPWENRPSKVIWKVFLYLYFCHVWKDLKGGVETVLGIIFLTGYRHFHLKKRKVKQVLYMKMLRTRCLKTVIFVLESPWKVLDFAQQKSVWTLNLELLDLIYCFETFPHHEYS